MSDLRKILLLCSAWILIANCAPGPSDAVAPPEQSSPSENLAGPVDRPPITGDSGPVDDCRLYLTSPEVYQPEQVPDSCLAVYNRWWNFNHTLPLPASSQEVHAPILHAPPVAIPVEEDYSLELAPHAKDRLTDSVEFDLWESLN